MIRTPSPRVTVVLVSAVGILLTLDLTVLAVAADAIAAELRLGLDGVQWATNGYALTYAAMLLPSGALADRVGRRLVFTWGVGVFTAASLLCAAAGSGTWLITGRVCQGVGAALAIAPALALLTAAYPDERARQRVIAWFASVSAAAAAIAPFLGGALVQFAGWRWVFLINLPIGLAVIVASSALPRQLAQRRGTVDWVGALLAIGFVFAVNIALLRAPQDGWAAPTVLACAALAVVALIVLVLHQLRVPEPLLDLRLLRMPVFVGGTAVAFLARFSGVGMLVFLTLHLQGTLGYTPIAAGVALLPMSVLLVLLSPVTGRLHDRVRATTLISVGLGISAVGLAWSSTEDLAGGWTALLPALVALGIGGALFFPPLVGTVLRAVPPDRAGTASGMINASFPLGMAAGVAILGALASARIGTVLPAGLETLRPLVEAARFRELPAHAVEAARAAYASGLSAQLQLAAAAAAVAAVIAATMMRTPAPVAQPALDGVTGPRSG